VLTDLSISHNAHQRSVPNANVMRAGRCYLAEGDFIKAKDCYIIAASRWTGTTLSLVRVLYHVVG